MTLSIVTVVYSDTLGLYRTCQSVDEQIEQVHDHVVVGSGFSDEEKLALSADLARPNRSFYFDMDNSIYSAMNLGLRKACGKWVCFLNAGDVFTSAGSSRLIVKHATVGRCSAFSTAQTDGDMSYIRPPGKWKTGVLCHPGHQGFVAPLHDVAEERIRFNEENLIAADMEWMEACMRAYGIDAFPEVIAEFALGGISNLPSWKAFDLQFKAKQHIAALRLVPKIVAYKILGRRQYFYMMARMRGYSVVQRPECVSRST